METVTLRLLPHAEAGGPTNMAADEVLLLSAAQGAASLRFYGWTKATVTLGYFQPAAARFRIPQGESLAWVRRPSGGAALVHHHELTYCLALPPGPPWQCGDSWMVRMHGIIAQALQDFGLDLVPRGGHSTNPFLCFQQHTPGDLTCRGHKVVGSAQRKYRHALMQHGGILLKTSEVTPQLPGIEDLTEKPVSAADCQIAILEEFARQTQWRLSPQDWSESEKLEIEALTLAKYGSPAWNEKR